MPSKLVRDSIPDIIRAEGRVAKIRIANDEEYQLKLREKLQEEVNEFLESENVEELADILEVVYALNESAGKDRNILESICEKKFHDRGGFSKRIILET